MLARHISTLRLGLQPPKLRTFIITLILLVIMPSLLLMFYTAWEQNKTARNLAQQQLASLVQMVVSEQNQLIAGTRQLLMSMSQLPSVQDPAKASQCNALLASLLKPHPYYTNFGVAGTDGNMYCSALPMGHRVNIRDRPYFQRTLAAKGFGIGEYQVGRVTGQPAINFSYPLDDRHGRIHGVIFAALSLDWLGELVADSNLPPAALLKIIDRNGHILASYPQAQDQVDADMADSALFRHIQNHPGKDSVILPDSNRTRHFYTYSPLIDPDAGIYVAVSVPQQQLTAHVDRQFQRNILLLVLLSFVISTIAWVFSRKLFLQRILTLTNAARKLRDGDLGMHTGLQHSDDELGFLGQAFDSMSESLRMQQNRLEMTSEELQRSNRALKTLSACNRALIHATDVQQLLDRMCQLIVEVGGYRMACIGVLRNPDDSNIEIHAHAGINSQYLDDLSACGLSGADQRNPMLRAAQDSQIVILQGTRATSASRPDHAQTGFPQHASVIALPLQSDNHRGALSICADDRHAFDQHEVRLLEEMVDDIKYGISTLQNQVRKIQAEEHIRHLAYYDPLTDLPNRYHLENELDMALRRDGVTLAVLMININRFNEINNTIGYCHADELLRAFGPRLSEILPPQTYVARTGGDIFAVILPDYHHDAATDLANEIHALSRQPFEIAGLRLDVSATIGISLFPDHGNDAATLIRRASLAMHSAKHAHNAIFVYDSSLDQHGPRQLTMATELRHAIEQGGLQLYFQPKVDIKTHTVVSVEALCRWSHHEYGDVSPAEFIPLAEHTGLIMPLTLWVLQEACDRLQDWCSQGLYLPIAVNLAARNLYQPDLIAYISRLCQERQLPQQLLELELTESDLMDDPFLCQKTLNRLHEMGIVLYIDDFGTGYSSLAYIKKLPMSAIKIDQSFVFDLMHNIDAETIVKSTIAMAHELKMSVVAEGVESKELYDKLSRLGCDQAQGYYIARPLPNTEFLTWLRQGPWVVAENITSRPRISGAK